MLVHGCPDTKTFVRGLFMGVTQYEKRWSFFQKIAYLGRQPGRLLCHSALLKIPIISAVVRLVEGSNASMFRDFIFNGLDRVLS